MKKARIIVLSGQSNAVGVGHIKCLKRSFSDAKIEEYCSGYENIKINYYSHDKKSSGFTKTTPGCTETNKDTIGPELGIAEYLSEKYPNEEFFIAKFAVGGASLHHDFLPPSSGGYYTVDVTKNDHNRFIDAFLANNSLKPGWCYNGLVSVLKDSIDILTENGFTPEIIGFFWMQGESDAGSLEEVNNYRTFFDNFIRDIKNTFSPYLNACMFVDAGISEIWNCFKEMNAFKQEYAENHYDFKYLDTIGNGLTTLFEPIEEPDIAHYDCESVIKLGKLFIESII